MENKEIEALLAAIDELKAKMEDDAAAARDEQARLAEEVKQLKEVPASEEEELQAEKARLTELVKNSVKNRQVAKLTDTKSTDGTIKNSTIPEFSRVITEYAVKQSDLVGLFPVVQTENTNYQHPCKVGKTAAAIGKGYPSGNPDMQFNKGSFAHMTVSPELELDTISDAFFDAHAFIRKSIVEDFGTLSADQILNGVGASQYEMKGYMSFFDATKTTDTARGTTYFKTVDASAETLKADALFAKLENMVLDTLREYRAGASFVMSKAVFTLVKGLRTEKGELLIQRNGQDSMIYEIAGYPVVVDEFLPDAAPVVFGDVAASFTLLEAPKMLEIESNPYKKDGYVSFPAQHRVGGVVANNQAVIGLILPSSVAPY